MHVGDAIPPTHFGHDRHTDRHIYIYHAKSLLNTPVWGTLCSPNYYWRRWSLAKSSGWLWRQKKKEEEDWRMMQLPNSTRLAMGMDEERKARLEKMVATTQLTLPLIKGVFNVGVVLSQKKKDKELR